MFQPASSAREDAVQKEGPACDHCGDRLAVGPGAEIRCTCGSLLAVRRVGFLEIKCRRCKQVARIPTPEAPR